MSSLHPPSATESNRPGTTDTVETQQDSEARHKHKRLHRVLTRLDGDDLSSAERVSAIVGLWLFMSVPGVGIYALNGFLGLVLGQAVLRAIHPGDPGYATSVRSTMQIGAVGSGVLGVAIWAVVLMLLCLAAVSRNVKGFARTMNMSTSIRKDLGSLAFYTAVGAASGPLGVAILKHHRSASQRADMLNVSDAARVGALGWFLLAVSWLLNHQSNTLKSRDQADQRPI
ncbi:uncharacterized protein C8Q71DRAFT_373818 [Rhodofomes roseus]|uniref:Uncharacterized protein n=1 Tax=Rhodofomes roseus TaxID=34475 RepID=A0ABQ8K0T2_9APHY|nr:uncharacterized protein C8Q71DRAFT_373818 [Rhodofomes roseus]KAH9830299.1 hypothetical protein C8Q71DRAFT_373818 [Rhodofomes roseus]